MQNDDLNAENILLKETASIQNLDAVKKALNGIDEVLQKDPAAKSTAEQTANPEEAEEQEDKENIEESEEEANDENATADTEDQVEAPQKKERKLWRERKKQYRLIAEKEALQKENDKLRNLLNNSLESGTYHYTQNAYLDLEKAKEQRKAAIQTGDIDALNSADENFQRALFKINEIERWEQQNKTVYKADATNNDINALHYTPPQQPQVSQVEQAIINDWFEQHPYLDKRSPKYDENLAVKIGGQIRQYEQRIVNGEIDDTIYSDKYFDYIDRYINSVRNPQKQTRHIGSANYVGGVRNARGQSSTAPKHPTEIELTPTEKEWVAAWGMSEEHYKQSKLKHLKGK